MPNALPASFLSAVKDLLGPSGWSDDPQQLEQVATPWRGNYKGSTPLIVRPASTGEAAALVALCAAHHVAITPQGGNTGLIDGGTPHGEICVSMTRMNRVRMLDPLNNSLTIEAGATLHAARVAAGEAGRLFPLSLGSEGSATIGGLISTNAGGVAVLRYGMMRDLVLGLEVVLASGEVWNGLSGLRKNNTGYDLRHLFAGAEGTLGLITAATLKLFPKVEAAVAWATCESAEKVVRLLAAIQAHVGDAVTGFEIIPRNAVEMVASDIPNIRDPLPSPAPWRVLIEISQASGDLANQLLEKALGAAMEEGLVEDAVIAASLAQADGFWLIRESIPLSKRAYGTALNQDISVPVSHIPAFIEACNSAVRAILPEAEFVIFGHVGDGNLHYSVVEPAGMASPLLAARETAIIRTIFDTVISYGGSISAEHGVGRMKRDELVRLRPPAATSMMRAIKQALDPQGIMNPGRVIDIAGAPAPAA